MPASLQHKAGMHRDRFHLWCEPHHMLKAYDGQRILMGKAFNLSPRERITVES
jgi:hypothetical protein